MDIILNKIFTDELLEKALINVFGFQVGTIYFSSEIPHSDLPEFTRLLVIVSIHKETQLLMFFPQDKKIVQCIDKVSVVKLCAELDCCALISDDEINPYSRIEITPEGRMSQAFLDVSKLDDNNEFVVVRRESLHSMRLCSF